MANSSSIFTIAWVKGAGERAIKSFVQGGVTGLLGSGVVNASDVASRVPDVLALPWYAALSAGLATAILSVATSVLGPEFTAGVSNDDPPGAVDVTDGEPADEDEAEVEALQASDGNEVEPIENGPIAEAGLATGALHAADDEDDGPDEDPK